MHDLTLTDRPYPPPSDNRARWMMRASPRVAARRIVSDVLEARAGEVGVAQVHRDDVECAEPFAYGACKGWHLTPRQVASPDPVSVAARAELDRRRRAHLEAMNEAGRRLGDAYVDAVQTVWSAMQPVFALSRGAVAAMVDDVARLGRGEEVRP